MLSHVLGATWGIEQLASQCKSGVSVKAPAGSTLSWKAGVETWVHGAAAGCTDCSLLIEIVSTETLLICDVRLWLALPRVERLHGFVFKASGSWQLVIGFSSPANCRMPRCHCRRERCRQMSWMKPQMERTHSAARPCQIGDLLIRRFSGVTSTRDSGLDESPRICWLVASLGMSKGTFVGLLVPTDERNAFRHRHEINSCLA